MKHILLVAFIIGLAILSRAQTEYEVSGTGANKVLKGLISRDMLEKDPSFKWFQANREGYTPSAAEVNTLKAKKQELQFLVFGATWNDDSRQILPKFFELIDAAGIDPDQVTLIGVDHDKSSVNDLSQRFDIKEVPTFIILKKGAEVGRVIVKKKAEAWDREIAWILDNRF